MEICHHCNGTGKKPWDPSDGYGMAPPPVAARCLWYRCKEGIIVSIQEWQEYRRALFGA